ncbi:MAG: restriction endonuclease subunit S [Ignavibacteria bacterium]|nr:restriction endonuclease subunit S [Ignavibacteria bacterium]
MNNNETRYTLPAGWIWTTLDLVSKNITDGSHNPPSKQGSGIPMLSARNIENGRITFDEVRYISESDYEYENQRARIEAGDVLLTIVATIGRSAIISTPLQQRFALQRSVAAIKPLINGHFLMYVFQAPEFQKLLTDNAKGTAQKGVYLKTLRELPIPLPPLPEQQRIVSRIEELFSELDHAEEGLKKAQKQLEVYRQALLKSAFEGKLTEKWRKEYKDVSYCWINKKISEIGNVRGGKRLPKNRYYSNVKTQYPYIRVTDFNNYSINQDIIRYISKELSDSLSNYKITDNDVYISIAGTIGLSGMVPESLNNAILTENAAKIITDVSVLSNKFLTYAISAPKISTQIKEKTKATSQPKLSLDSIRNIQIDLPDLEEQRQIVIELEMRFTLIENLENSIDDGLRKIRLLQQSILRKAFEGKLVPQSKNDEPATTLLKQISKEKESYILDQKMIVKEKPKNKKPMDTNNTIKEILEKTVQPIESRELWLKSKHKDNIEEFYAELKKIEHEIDILIEGKESSIILKR